MTKKNWRKEMATRRAAVVTEGAAKKIAADLIMLPEIEDAEIIAGYYPMMTEVDCLIPLKVFHAAHYRIALPVVGAKASPLIFREWDLSETLKSGPLGTSEPGEEFHRVMPDVMLIPLLGFDNRGHRLGHGGGYYDRTLQAFRQSNNPVLAIGIAYEAQKLDELPIGKYDQQLDIVVTEKNIYRFD